MDSWDSGESDTEAALNNATVTTVSKWEGEDEEEEVKDSWDQEPEEEKSDENKTGPQTQSKKKKLVDKLEEKERKKKDKKVSNDVDSDKVEMTPEDLLAEKLRRQQLQEEADLNLAKEVFGVGVSVLDTKEDYEWFKNEILKKTADCTKDSTNYAAFTEDLIQSLCAPLSSADLKKIHNLIGNLHIEKAKIERGEKSKKSKSKSAAKLRKGDAIDYNEYSAYTEDDYDDFI